MNIANILLHNAEKYPQKPFVMTKDTTLTYGEFLDKARRLANGLYSLGVRKDEKVGLFMMNSIDYMLSYFAIAAMGGCAVPLNTAFTPHEVAHQLNDSEAVAVIADAALISKALKAQPQVSKLRYVIPTEEREGVSIPSLLREDPLKEIAPRDLNDVMHLIYTSGTTGIPKGAMITHGNINWMVGTLNTFYGEQAEDVFICALPLFHAYGKLQSFLAAVNVGATIVLIERFDPATVMEAISMHKNTVFFGVPTMYNMMINSLDIEKFDLTSLKICVSGGASLPIEVLKAFREKSGVSIAEGYGLSEVTVMTHCCPVDGLQKAGSIGPVLPGLESKVFNKQDEEVPSGAVGELVVKGPSIMKGYYKKPEETDVAMRNGWFHTGDLVIEDDDKYVFVVDRIKDMYIRGGKNVYPREIEEVLYAHPKVNEAAVIGIPDDRYGEEGVAYIVLKGMMEATEEEFMEYLREKVARFKLPKYIRFLDQLPKNSVGKILKRELSSNIV